MLLHMAEADKPVTSETMAKAMGTNPVVIRRIMAGLRDGGFLRSEKGHGGGWSITRDLALITLRDVHTALGKPELFAIGNRSEAPCCLVEQAVNAAMNTTFDEAEALLLERFGKITLAQLSADFHDRLVVWNSNSNPENFHAA